MSGDIVLAAKFIGAGLSMIGALGAGIGIGLSVQGALEGMARNPDTYGNLLMKYLEPHLVVRSFEMFFGLGEGENG